jgi:hypothetical protein
VGAVDAGFYSVVVSNYTGSVTSSVAALTLNINPPTIVNQPADQGVDAGYPATFLVQATGAAPLTYQWWKDSAPLADGGNVLGVTSNQLSLFQAAQADVGLYFVIVSNHNGSVTSSIAALTLNTNPPVIVTPPANLTLVAGQTAVFQVTASGSQPLAYAWQFNGQTIGGATQSTYTRSSVQTSDGGDYSVVITNNFGAVTSAAAKLTVQPPGLPIVIAQWNFNNTSNAVTSPLPSKGAGTAALIGGATATYASGSSTDTNAVNNAWNTSGYPAPGTGNKTGGVQFNVSTRGYRNLGISWDERLSNSGSKYVRLQYSTDGINFIDGPVVVGATSFQSKSNSLAGIPGVDDNPNFAIRVVAEFESTAITNANANYATASTSMYGSGGTARFDMMTISGSAIPGSAALTVLGHGVDWLQISVTGTPGLSYAVNYSSDLNTWTPMLTNMVPFTFFATNLPSAAVRFYKAVYSP